AAVRTVQVSPRHDVNMTISARCFFKGDSSHRVLHSFPTRRSSDLGEPVGDHPQPAEPPGLRARGGRRERRHLRLGRGRAAGRLRDRKSTRLNSSHLVTSYAVFCLKKKKPIMPEERRNHSKVTKSFT